jgi:hypothetical protein
MRTNPIQFRTTLLHQVVNYFILIQELIDLTLHHRILALNIHSLLIIPIEELILCHEFLIFVLEHPNSPPILLHGLHPYVLVLDHSLIGGSLEMHGVVLRDWHGCILLLPLRTLEGRILAHQLLN